MRIHRKTSSSSSDLIKSIVCAFVDEDCIVCASVNEDSQKDFFLFRFYQIYCCVLLWMRIFCVCAFVNEDVQKDRQ